MEFGSKNTKLAYLNFGAVHKRRHQSRGVCQKMILLNKKCIFSKSDYEGEGVKNLKKGTRGQWVPCRFVNYVF